MSYIVRVGNLASTPELRQNDKGDFYTYARVLVSDTVKKGDQYVECPAVAYNVSVSGNQAKNLVEAAQASGNIRVLFAGTYRVTESSDKQGNTYVQHEVRADDVAVSLRGQKVTVG